MLTIQIEPSEFFDERNGRFITVKSQKIMLEHSLMSIRFWESKWHKSYFNHEKTVEEFIDYIRCMTITKNIDPLIYRSLNRSMIESIKKYINSQMSALKFEEERRIGRETVTSELIYYWMIKFGIPFECEKWHLNQLLSLIKVCERKENPRKMSMSEIYARNTELNEARKKKYNTRG